MFLAICSVGYSKAQTGFLEISQTTVMELTPEQLVRFNEYISDTHVLWFSLVDMGDLPTVQVNGELHIQHPQKSCVAAFKAKWVDVVGQDSYYWYGEAPETYDSTSVACNCCDATINVTYDTAGYFISLAIDEENYRILPLGEGMHIMLKIASMIPYGLCGHDLDSIPGTRYDNGASVSIQPSSIRDVTHCPVRVLFLYTPSASSGFGGHSKILKLVSESLHFTNQAYRNSRVNNLKLQLAGLQLISWEPNEGLPNWDLMDELVVMMNPGELIGGLRQQFLADMVVVIFKNNVHQSGRAGTLELEDARMVAWVNPDKKAPFSLLVAHETAHLFGCRHQYNAGPPDPTFNRAHRYWTPGFIWKNKRLTITHEGDHGSGYIQHYSNPEVTRHGAPTGEEDRNNARQLREQACNVAGFMQEPPQFLNLHITGERLGCPCDFVTLGAGYNVNLLGTYNFEWRTSADGFNWSTVQSVFPGFAVQLPCEPGGGVFVQLTLIPPSGPASSTSIFVEAVPDPYPGVFCMRSASSAELQSARHRVCFKIFPNPTRDYLNVELTNIAEQGRPDKIELVVYNALGQIILKDSPALSASSMTIPLWGWQTGAYWLSINHSSPQMFLVEN